MRLIALSVFLIFISGVVLVGTAQGHFVAQTSMSLEMRIANEGLDVLLCSYFGGDDEEWSNDIFFGDDGSIVLTGMSRSSDLPVVNAHQEEYGGGGDVFIVKLNPEFQIEFYTYFGGSGLEEPMALMVDYYQNIIVAGGTSSDNLTILNPLQDELNGPSDAFLAKFSPSGALLFSTYLGGNESDRIEDICIDSNGDYLMVGSTGSSDFNTTAGAYQEDYGGGESDVFITGISISGQSILYSTFFGNSADEDAFDIDVNLIGGIDDLVIVGLSRGTTITTASAYQQTYGGGTSDAIVAKFASDCSSLNWSTMLGGNGWEFGDQIGFDSDNNLIVSGYTGSSDFPLLNQLQNNTSGYDAFIAELSTNGDELIMSSYLGGNLEDRSYAMEVLPADAILITMPSSSADMPTINPFQANNSGGSDGYIALISGETQGIVFGSYFGGQMNDYVLGMSISGAGMVAVIGYTNSDDLPTLRALQDEYGGGTSDTMVWILGFESVPTPSPIIYEVIIVAGVAVVGVIVYTLRRKN